MPQPPSLVSMGKDRVVQIKRMVRNDRKIGYCPISGIRVFLIQNCTDYIYSYCLQLLLSHLYLPFIHSAADSCFQVFMTKGFCEHSCTYLLMVVMVMVVEEEEDMCKSFFWVYD